jgi:hypothetical protein
MTREHAHTHTHTHTPGVVGAKANNLAKLRNLLPEWIRVPSSVALPFGAFEAVLAYAPNAAVGEALQVLQAQLAAAQVSSGKVASGVWWWCVCVEGGGGGGGGGRVPPAPAAASIAAPGASSQHQTNSTARARTCPAAGGRRHPTRARVHPPAGVHAAAGATRARAGEGCCRRAHALQRGRMCACHAGTRRRAGRRAQHRTSRSNTHRHARTRARTHTHTHTHGRALAVRRSWQPPRTVLACPARSCG